MGDFAGIDHEGRIRNALLDLSAGGADAIGAGLHVVKAGFAFAAGEGLRDRDAGAVGELDPDLVRDGAVILVGHFDQQLSGLARRLGLALGGGERGEEHHEDASSGAAKHWTLLRGNLFRP